jgi:hypothetical protein
MCAGGSLPVQATKALLPNIGTSATYSEDAAAPGVQDGADSFLQNMDQAMMSYDGEKVSDEYWFLEKNFI